MSNTPCLDFIVFSPFNRDYPSSFGGPGVVGWRRFIWHPLFRTLFSAGRGKSFFKAARNFAVLR
jgi:hypothetical protein